MLTKVIEESFIKERKGCLRSTINNIIEKLREYSLGYDYKHRDGISLSLYNEKYEFTIPSINAKISIGYNEEDKQISTEDTIIAKSKIDISFYYPENTPKKDLKILKNIFLKNGLKKEN